MAQTHTADRAGPYTATPIGPSAARSIAKLSLAARTTLRPSLLTAAAVLLVCVPADERDLAASMQVTLADLAVVALVVVAAAQLLWTQPVRGGMVWLLAAATLMACALATLTAPDTATSVTGFVRYAEVFVLVPVAVAVNLHNRLDLGLVCAAMLAAGVIEGVVGTWQAITNTGAAYGDRGFRAVGTFSAVDIMAMANVVGYAIVVAVGLALTLRGRARTALVMLAAALVVPLLASLSRGAWLATAVAVAVMVLLVSLRLAARLAVVAIAVAVVVAIVPVGGSGQVRARIVSAVAAATSPDRSVSDRYLLWHTAAAMWRDHPVTGVGPRHFPAFRDAYAPLSLPSGSDTDDGSRFQRTPLLSPHNTYLLVLSEQGLLGLLAFGAFLAALAVGAVRRAHRAVTTRSGTAGTAVVAVAAVGLLAWNLVTFVYSDPGGPSTVLMAVTFGVALWWVAGADLAEVA